MSSAARTRVLLITLIAMFGFWYYSKDQQPETTIKPVVEPVFIATKKADPTQKTETHDSQDFGATPPKGSSAVGFSDVAERLQICLSIPKTEFSMEGPSSIQTFSQYLQLKLGEIVFSSEEWRNTELSLANGEKRRIRIEYDMGENEEYVKKLKYFSVAPDNTVSPLYVAAEHSENPTESFIESLEKEGDVTLNERAQRMYFKDGSELYAVEKNGLLREAEVSKDGKLFRCSQMDTPGSSCECL